MKLAIRTTLVLSLGLLIAASAQAETYEVDAAHSQISFKVKHFGISTVRGEFTDFSASFDVNPDDLSTLEAKATIDAASVDTREQDRDNHLRSEDFLAVESHPEIRFASKKAEPVGGNKVKLHGDLTIRGVTKPVVLDAEFGGAVEGMRGEKRAAFIATTTIDRKDFGVSWNRVLDSGGLVVGDEVTIELEIEGIQKSGTTD